MPCAQTSTQKLRAFCSLGPMLTVEAGGQRNKDAPNTGMVPVKSTRYFVNIKRTALIALIARHSSQLAMWSDAERLDFIEKSARCTRRWTVSMCGGPRLSSTR